MENRTLSILLSISIFVVRVLIKLVKNNEKKGFLQ